jgi:hypothetical protein
VFAQGKSNSPLAVSAFFNERVICRSSEIAVTIVHLPWNGRVVKVVNIEAVQHAKFIRMGGGFDDGMFVLHGQVLGRL